MSVITEDSRLFDLIDYISSHEDTTAKELAERFSTTEERIYENLNDLNAAGIPIFFSPSGYRVLSPSFQVPQELTFDESLQLAIGISLLETNGVINTDQAQRLRLKIIPSTTDISVDDLEKIGETIKSTAPLNHTINPDVMTVLNQAILKKRRMRMKYLSRTNTKPAWRELSPYTVVHRKGTWYVIGYCHKRDEIRTFKVSRIEEIENSSQLFHEDEEFDLDEYLIYSWSIMAGEPNFVMVRFDREVGQLILEKRITNGRIWKEKGFVYLQTVVSGLEEFSWWIMQYGEHAEVLQPRELRRMLARRCTKMAEKYQKVVSKRSIRIKQCRNIFP